jgi:hypothetical protein
MASHMTSIGFEAEDEEAFVELAARADERGELIETGQGVYLRWALPCGAELWAQITPEEELCGMNPHFAGRGRLPAVVSGRVEREDDTPLDGSFLAWAQDPEAGPEATGEEPGLFPFVFDCPDAARQAGRTFPARTALQLSAFAHELEAFPDEAAFLARSEEEVKLAPRAFLPVGMFREEGEAEGPPEALALFSGRVAAVETRANEHSGREFLWLLVETLGGSLDVVADPEVVAGEVVAGGTVLVTGWLSGRWPD